jgi:chromosome segregation ATPase
MLAAPAAAPAPQDNQTSRLIKKLDTYLDSQASGASRDRLKAQNEVLDAVIRELKGTDDAFVTRLQERFDQTNRLSGDVAARDSQIRELRASLEHTAARVRATEADAQATESSLKTRLAEAQSATDRLRAQLQDRDKRLAAFDPKLKAKSAGAAGTDDSSATIWYIVAGILAGVLGGVVIALVAVPAVFPSLKTTLNKLDNEPAPPSEAPAPSADS